MKFFFLIAVCPILLLNSCGSEPESEGVSTETPEVNIDNLSEEAAEELILIDMYPEVEFGDTDPDIDYTMSSIASYKGTIGDEPIELQISNILGEYRGRYFYSNSPKSNFAIEGKIYGYLDTLSLHRNKDGEVSEAFNFSTKDEVLYDGYWAKEGDTLALQLELISVDLVTTQLLLDNTSDNGLIITENGVYGQIEPGYPRAFNTYQTFYEDGTGTDTGQMWDIYQNSVFRRDSTIILIESVIYNAESAIYLEGHGYDSDDPISEGETNDASVKIVVSVINEGIAEEKEIDFIYDDDNLDLFIFKDYLIFAGVFTDKSVVYKWDDTEMNYLELD